MRKQYDGLDAMKIQLDNKDVITASTCLAMIQLELDSRGVCITDPDFQQIEYVGDQG